MMETRYTTYAEFLKNKFGFKIYKVSVDAGFTCPNIDGRVAYGGCTFCNNASFTPQSIDRRIALREQINNGIAFLKRRYRAQKFVVYFQPYTNTYATKEELDRLWAVALENKDVIGMTIGTRPDCVDEEKIKALEELARDYFITVEYGVQSIYDRTLELINRAHNYQCFLDALRLTKGRGIYICTHVILGFPNESREEKLAMADEMSRIGPDFLKVHHLQVIKGTQMAKAYQAAPFPLPGYEEYLELVCDFIERLAPTIALQRLFAEAVDDLLIAPRWHKSGQEIYRDIVRKLEARESYQGKHLKRRFHA